MKRLLPAFILSLILIQLISLPVSGAPNGFHPVATITTQPATAITPNSAQLNATITWPAITINNPAGNLRPVSYDTDLQLATIADSTGYFRYGESPAALTYQTAAMLFVLRGITCAAVW